MSNMDAAVGLAQLAALGKNAEDRQQNASAMGALLDQFGQNCLSDFAGMLLKLVIVLPQGGPGARKLVEVLADEGIEAQLGYAPLHRATSASPARCPVTDALWERVLCVPVDTRLREVTLTKLQGRLRNHLSLLHPTEAA